MIINYEICYRNREEVLFIYLDYNTEFAKFNSNKNKSKLKNEIKKYIKKNKIDFKGTTVAIMVGGLMLGTIMLNKPKEKYIDKSLQNNIVSILDDNNINKDDLLYDKEYTDILDEEKSEEIIEVKENLIDKKTEFENINNKEQKNELKNEDKINQEVDVKIEEDSLDIEKPKVVDEIVYIDLYRNNGRLEKMGLEEYVVGVVAAEMPASFNKEALKAQSVLARTYALKCINRGKKITDNSTTQNYKSINELKDMWGISFDTYYNKILNAVESTKGEYLSYNGDYIDAVYHSTSNGITEDSIYVWGNSFPYLVSVDSIYDNTNKNFLVKTFFNYEDISKKLGRIITIDSVIEIISRSESGRVSNIEIDGISYSGVDFRNLLSLRSADFDIEKVSDGINITTRGYGHGVGMSQYGANGMANNGYNYKDILLHYYKGVSLNKN